MNLNLVKIQFLSGYKTDNEGQSEFLSAPVWKALDLNSLSENTNNLLCRLVYHVDKRFGVGTDDNVKLPFLNKYFFISSRDISESTEEMNAEEENLEVLKTSYFTGTNYNFDFSFSNVVSQSGNMFTETEFSTPIEEAQQFTSFGTSQPTSNVVTPTVGTSGGGTGGSGY